jgi:hypothetical protein
VLKKGKAKTGGLLFPKAFRDILNGDKGRNGRRPKKYYKA